jgi:hypothetical protein
MKATSWTQAKEGDGGQLVMLPDLMPIFEVMLRQRGWEPFPIPHREDDLPTFGIRPRDIGRDGA